MGTRGLGGGAPRSQAGGVGTSPCDNGAAGQEEGKMNALGGLGGGGDGDGALGSADLEGGCGRRGGQDRKSGAREKGLCSSPVGEAQPEPGPRHGAGRAAGGRQALDILGPALPWQAGPWVPGSAGGRGLAPSQPDTLLQVSALSWVGWGRSGGEGRPVCPLRGPPLLDPLFGLCLPAFSRGSKRGGVGDWAGC